MTRGTRPFSAIASIAIASITLAACDNQAAKGPPTAAGKASATATAPDRNGRLLNAAEGYETLTETAFDKPIAELTATLTTARRQASGVQTLLSPDPAAKFAALDKAIDLAIGVQDRTAIALTSVETYRVLVSAQDASASAPVEISLLDYAGFRYDALSRSSPVDWGAMAADMTYARETWARLSPGVSAGLIGSFDGALAEMDAAVRQQDASAARTAASRELALVDALEAYFAALNSSATPAPPPA